MLDLSNLPPDFWTSLEFVCLFFGLLPLILFQVVALGLVSVDIVRESKWYMNRGIRTVYVQTDDDTELMEFYASGASPLDLNPDSSSSGSTTPPYPSTSTSNSTSDPAPSTSSQATSRSSSPPDPSPSDKAQTQDISSSASSESNQAPEPSTPPPQTTQLSALPEIIIEHQASDSCASSPSDSLDGWANTDDWSSSTPPAPPKITSMLLKNTSSGNLSTSKSSSFYKSPMRMTLSSNSNFCNGVSNTFSRNPFANSWMPSAATRDMSDDVELLDFDSCTYRKNKFSYWEKDFSSSENVVEERASREVGSANPAFDHTEIEMPLSTDSICKTMNGIDCKSSVRSGLGCSSLKSASSDQYFSEVYMGIV